MARHRIVASVGAQTMRNTRASQGPRRPPSEGRPSGLTRIFAVPDGEPVAAWLAHIQQLTPGERLWFEQGVRVGDHVLVPYERLDDPHGGPTHSRIRLSAPSLSTPSS